MAKKPLFAVLGVVAAMTIAMTVPSAVVRFVFSEAGTASNDSVSGSSGRVKSPAESPGALIGFLSSLPDDLWTMSNLARVIYGTGQSLPVVMFDALARWRAETPREQPNGLADSGGVMLVPELILTAPATSGTGTSAESDPEMPQFRYPIISGFGASIPGPVRLPPPPGLPAVVKEGDKSDALADAATKIQMLPLGSVLISEAVATLWTSSGLPEMGPELWNALPMGGVEFLGKTGKMPSLTIPTTRPVTRPTLPPTEPDFDERSSLDLMPPLTMAELAVRGLLLLESRTSASQTPASDMRHLNPPAGPDSGL